MASLTQDKCKVCSHVRTQRPWQNKLLQHMASSVACQHVGHEESSHLRICRLSHSTKQSQQTFSCPHGANVTKSEDAPVQMTQASWQAGACDSDSVAKPRALPYQLHKGDRLEHHRGRCRNKRPRTPQMDYSNRSVSPNYRVSVLESISTLAYVCLPWDRPADLKFGVRRD